jgi:PilZ domain
MATDDAAQERRREHREKVKITVLLKMGVLLNGRGIAQDISQHGMRLISSQIFKVMSSVQQKDFIGAPLRIMLPVEALTVNGLIAWVDLKRGEGAINITSTSDDEKWMEFISSNKI